MLLWIPLPEPGLPGDTVQTHVVCGTRSVEAALLLVLCYVTVLLLARTEHP